MRVTIVHKNRHRKPPHLLSHQRHEVEVCRGKRSIRGKSNPVMILRQPCRDYLKGTCTRSPCEYWHPPECQFYKTESGCEAGDKRLFPHHQVDEQPKKSEEELQYFQRGEGEDKNAVAVAKIVPQCACETRFGVTGFSKRHTVPVKLDAKSLGTNSTSTVDIVYATSSKYPGKQRTSIGKIQVKNSSSAKSSRFG